MSRTLNRIFKSILPAPVLRPLVTVRSNERNQAEHAKLIARRVELSPKHIGNLKVVPSRADLLREMPKGQIIAEIGVYKGEFSEEILAACQPKKFFLIDTWEPTHHEYGPALGIVQNRFAKQVKDGTVEIRQGTSRSVLGTLPNGFFDWVYLDAAHDYESVRAELELLKSKVKPDGLISGHDYSVWSSNGMTRFGVIEAVNAFCVENNWELLRLSNEADRLLSYLIKKIS